MTDPDMGHWEYTYDLNGNLKTQTDSRGITLTFDYDELNRQIKKTYPDQSVALYEYDAAIYGIGFLHRTINANATIEISSYDALGRPLSENKIINPSTDTIFFDYEYDLVGRVTSKTISKNNTPLQTFNYTFYPETSLLQQVMDGNNQAYAEITQYSPQGKIESISYADQAVLTNYAYSAKTGRLDAINSYRTSDFIPLSYKIYEYSKAGDITLISDVVKDVDFVYTYDHAHRLISEESEGAGVEAATTVEVIEFTYGEEESNPADYPVHAPSKIHTQTTASQTMTSTTNYTYSAAGNRTSKVEGTIASSYISNDDNMIETINVNGVTTNFTYDANNQRTKKTQGADTTLYYSQDFEIINNTPTSYLFAGNLRIGMVSGNATMFFVKDHLGSTNAIVTDTGQIVDTGEYMPYGQDRSSNDLLQTSSYKFTDQEQDDGTGLYNYDARLYDPVIGQFIMADTIVPNMFDSQSLNRYAYCLNNPVKYIDPTGHFEGLGSMEGMGDYNGFDSSSYQNPGHSIADMVNSEQARQEANATRQKEMEDAAQITAINVFIAVHIDRNYREAKRLLGTFTEYMFSLTGADYISLNVNVSHPRSQFTLYGLIGVSFQYVADKYGNNYWGFGPTVGKALKGVTVSLTLGRIAGRFDPSEDTLKSLLSGHGVNIGGGSILGFEATYNLDGLAAGEFGLYTPQYGAGYHYSIQKGKWKE